MGTIFPTEFVPISEHTGQIERLGDWVMYNSCKQFKTWLDRGINIGTLAINFSGVQLHQRDLPQKIQNILEEFQLDPRQLEIELTESSIVDFFDKDFSVSHLHITKIKAWGYRTSN